MISALDFLRTRVIGASSMTLMVGSQLVAISSIFSGSLISINPQSEHVTLNVCASGSCLAKAYVTNERAMLVGQSINSSTISVLKNEIALLSERSSELTHLELDQWASYSPPSCSDTDADQTNNCGPNDSGDAGTRMSV
ncbi:MAG: hypothetical protein AAGD25_15435 [Cyanobacteria bacterium P01_F01_bin.150]